MKLTKTSILEGELDVVISDCRKEVKKRKGAVLKKEKDEQRMRTHIIVEEQKE